LSEHADRRVSQGDESHQLLAVYLNDHLAGTVGGTELARRLRESNRDDPEFGPALRDLCAEIETDRNTLTSLMGRLDVKRGAVKPAGAWFGEKLGRLKLNGRLRGYSPLSRMLELEMLITGLSGKVALWSALEHALGQTVSGFDFAALAERADDQRTRVEDLHLSATLRTLPVATSSSQGIP
jgi:hypothetical protein